MRAPDGPGFTEAAGIVLTTASPDVYCTGYQLVLLENWALLKKHEVNKSSAVCLRRPYGL